MTLRSGVQVFLSLLWDRPINPADCVDAIRFFMQLLPQGYLRIWESGNRNSYFGDTPLDYPGLEVTGWKQKKGCILITIHPIIPVHRVVVKGTEPMLSSGFACCSLRW